MYPRNLDHREYDRAKDLVLSRLTKAETICLNNANSPGLKKRRRSTDSAFSLTSMEDTLENGFRAPDLKTLYALLETLTKRGEGSLLLSWIRFLDPTGRGKLNRKELAEALGTLGFTGNPNFVWRETFLRNSMSALSGGLSEIVFILKY